MKPSGTRTSGHEVDRRERRRRPPRRAPRPPSTAPCGTSRSRSRAAPSRGAAASRGARPARGARTTAGGEEAAARRGALPGRDSGVMSFASRASSLAAASRQERHSAFEPSGRPQAAQGRVAMRSNRNRARRGRARAARGAPSAARPAARGVALAGAAPSTDDLVEPPVVDRAPAAREQLHDLREPHVPADPARRVGVPRVDDARRAPRRSPERVTMSSASSAASDAAVSPASGLSRPTGGSPSRRGRRGRSRRGEREVVGAPDHLSVVRGSFRTSITETFASTMWLVRSFAMRNMSARAARVRARPPRRGRRGRARGCARTWRGRCRSR